MPVRSLPLLDRGEIVASSFNRYRAGTAGYEFTDARLQQWWADLSQEQRRGELRQAASGEVLDGELSRSIAIIDAELARQVGAHPVWSNVVWLAAILAVVVIDFPRGAPSGVLLLSLASFVPIVGSWLVRLVSLTRRRLALHGRLERSLLADGEVRS